MPAALKTSEPSSQPARATVPASAHLYVASAGEAGAGRSPALELQEALEVMLASPTHTGKKPVAVATLAISAMGAATVCAAFWLSLARVLMSAV